MVERDGRFPIITKPLDIDKVREEAERTIALHPSVVEIEMGDACSPDGSWHGKTYWDEMEILSMPCILVRIKAARQRKRKHAMLHQLRDCARDPYKANGLHTLEGMAQGTCNLDIK